MSGFPKGGMYTGNISVNTVSLSDVYIFISPMILAYPHLRHKECAFPISLLPFKNENPILETSKRAKKDEIEIIKM